MKKVRSLETHVTEWNNIKKGEVYEVFDENETSYFLGPNRTKAWYKERFEEVVEEASRDCSAFVQSLSAAQRVMLSELVKNHEFNLSALLKKEMI